MTPKNSRRNQARTVRRFRSIHRKLAIFLFIFFFFISISGLLLGWKKHSGGLISPKQHEGVSTNLEEWLPIHELNLIATQILYDSVSPDLSTELDRIDIRKELGLVKFVYKNHYWGIQLDGASGKLLNLEKRRSDFIENIHDGTIFDKLFGTHKTFIKLIYSSLMGLALLILTISGLWLWLGPKRIQRNNNK